MEPILFYGVPHGCSFGSIVALEWLGQPYRLSRVDMLAKEDGYGRVNALGETPTLLLENGETLTESLAILNAIAARDLGQRLGFLQGSRGFDRLNSILGYLHTSFHSAFAPLWTAFKLPKDAPEQAMLQRLGRENVAEAYAHLDRIMADRDWIAGTPHRTIADAYLVGIARWGEDLKQFNLAREYPRLYRHLQKLEADPAVAFAHAIEDGRPAKTSGGFLGHVTLQEVRPRLAA
jgi:glutathione S-transferase